MTNRTLLPITAAAAAEAVVRPVLLCALDFVAGMVRLTSAPFDITVDGEIYTGVGTLGAVSSVEEGVELQAYAINLQLSGIPSNLIGLALSDPAQGRDARLWIGFLDKEHRLIGAPLLLFRGRIDTLDITLGQEAVIDVTVQSRLADWERPRVRRYTHEDQKSQWADDRGLEHITTMAEKTITWGR